MIDWILRVCAATALAVAAGCASTPEPEPEPQTEQETQAESPDPVVMSDADLRLEMVQHIVNFEARRDSEGRILVYMLPPDDPGGVYEVAGVNDGFHPQMAPYLRDLVEAGEHARAEAEAVEYIADYTDRTASYSDLSAIKFLLRDMAWNRGPTGAVRTLQIALGVTVDGIFGPQTEAALRRAEQEPETLISEICAARETYERSRGRDESSSLWEGLANRWRNACERARSYL